MGKFGILYLKPMIKITRGHHISFKYAFEGLIYAFLTQPNFRVHFYVTVLALFLGYFFQISIYEWLILTITIFLVFIIELVNTSIEAATDLLVTDHNPIAKAAKDTASAAVLLAALFSIVVGLIIFLPRIIQ